jgi:hypothetical protein
MAAQAAQSANFPVRLKSPNKIDPAGTFTAFMVSVDRRSANVCAEIVDADG